ncbi:MAG TPA: DsbA family protein [Gaiellaceae bacterium]|jgi:protein-disulfide isomerase-like protein with CxxC motif
MIRATLFNDAACPWGYSANPALRVLEWRYGDQIDWRLVVIGLRDEVSEQMRQQFDPAGVSRLVVFRDRYGMPFSLLPKARAAASGRGCQAVVAARLASPGSEFRVLRALQLANFTTTLLLDDDRQIRDVLADVPGLDADAIVDSLDDPKVVAAYESDKAEARNARGTAIEAQGKASTTEPGIVRYTAPSIVFERDEQRLVAGGWQPTLAYDLCIANLDPTIARTPPPETPAPLLERFPDGLTTAEIAELLAQGPDYIPDLDAAEQAMVKLVADNVAARGSLGNHPIWLPTSGPREPAAEHAATAA